VPRAPSRPRPPAALRSSDVPGVVLSGEQLLPVDDLAQGHGGEGRPGAHAALAAAGAAVPAGAGGRRGERRRAEGAAGRRRARSSSCRGPPLEENAAVDGVLQGTAVAVLHDEPGLGQNPRCGLALRRGRGRRRGRVSRSGAGSPRGVRGPRKDDGALGRLEGLDDARVGLFFFRGGSFWKEKM